VRFSSDKTMQCYTRTNTYFREIEHFIRVQREAGNIDHARTRQARAQLNTISGENNTWWKNDYNFVRTTAVVLRMLMLKATKIHADYDREWSNLVTKGSIACQYNKDSIHTDGVEQMPCPADGLDEAGQIAAYYDTQFVAKKMVLHIRDMPENAGWFTETIAVVKEGERDIKFWFIITTWRIRKTPHVHIEEHDEVAGFLYDAVPFVAVIYMEGNHQACNDWQREQHQDFLPLEQLMENLNIDDNLKRAIRDNRAEAAADRDQNTA
jgi:hypothetical protein